MPVLDGNEACRKLRKEDTNIPIIAFTASVMSADTNEYYKNGFNTVLAKPLELDELYRILTNYLIPNTASLDK